MSTIEVDDNSPGERPRSVRGPLPEEASQPPAETFHTVIRGESLSSGSVWIVVTSVLFTVASAYCVYALSSSATPLAGSGWWHVIVSAGFGLLSLVLLVGAYRDPRRGGGFSIDSSDDEYARSQVAIAFVLLWLGVIGSSAMAGLAFAGRLHRVFPMPGDHVDASVTDLSDVQQSITVVEGTLERLATTPGVSDLRDSFETATRNLGSLLVDLTSGVRNQQFENSRVLLREARIAHVDATRDLAVASAVTAPDRSVLARELAVVGEFLRGLWVRASYSFADLAARILIMAFLAIFGSLLYIYQRIHEKRQAANEPFHRDLFFGGLWFRMGQAVLYTILLFLVMRSELGAPTGFTESMMPLLALLIGMYVKTAETVFRAFGLRVLQVLQVLVPPVPTSNGRRADQRRADPEVEGAPPVGVPPERLIDWYAAIVDQDGILVDRRKFRLQAPEWLPVDGSLAVCVTPAGKVPKTRLPLTAVVDAVRARLESPEVRSTQPDGLIVANIKIANVEKLATDGYLRVAD